MIDRIREITAEVDWGVLPLQISLIIIFVFIMFLIPTFEPGPDLAVFSASLAIVILSLLNSRSSEKQINLFEKQQELVERQNQLIESLREQNQEQSDILQDLRDNLDDSDSTDELDEMNSNVETEEINKSTTEI